MCATCAYQTTRRHTEMGYDEIFGLRWPRRRRRLAWRTHAIAANIEYQCSAHNSTAKQCARLLSNAFITRALLGNPENAANSAHGGYVCAIAALTTATKYGILV